MREGWFLAVAAIVIIGVVVTGALAVSAGDEDVETWVPDVPVETDLDEPPTDGMATIGESEYDTVQGAADAADPGETIYLTGSFEERIVLSTPNVTVTTDPTAGTKALIDGSGEDTVVTIDAPEVTVSDLWIRHSGTDRTNEDAGVLVNGTASTLEGLHITDSLFGIWVDGVTDVHIERSTIVGIGDLSLNERGNAIHLWQADGAKILDNAMTQVRDGIYYQWSSHVVAEGNSMWDLRYGVHYMYSDHNRLEGNLAFNNDVGFALMVSENLTIVNNTAVNNVGQSSHGILVKDIDRSEIRGNDLVANGNGLFVYNAHDNTFIDNLIMENRVGIHITAGSSGEIVTGNSFMHNDRAAFATATTRQVAWNGTAGGNYWSDARTVDLDGDGTSEIRHRPAGVTEQLVHRHPETTVFTESPSFDAIRLAESSFPVIEAAGIVDHHPLNQPAHDHWRTYYER